MRKLLLITLISSSISNSFAQDAIELQKGQAAPFTGILLTVQHSRHIYGELQEKEMTDSLNKSLEHSLSVTQKNYSIDEEKINKLTERNDKLAESLQQAQKTSDFEKFLYVGLGFGAAVLGAYIIKATTR